MPYDPTGRTSGQECSSTYEGRHVEFLESDLVHPDHTVGLTNLVQKGDPVVCQAAVGVALKTATAETDIIPVDTEGIWFLTVSPTAQLNKGDVVYIDPVTAGLSDDAGDVSYGYLVSAAVGAGDTEVAAIKVHWGGEAAGQT